MRNRIGILGPVALAAFLAVATAANAAGSCRPALMHSYDQAQAIVSSLHPDKPGQMRVEAANGSVFTSGETQWLRGQLRGVILACEEGREEAAETSLNGIRNVLRSHHVANLKQ